MPKWLCKLINFIADTAGAVAGAAAKIITSVAGATLEGLGIDNNLFTRIGLFVLVAWGGYKIITHKKTSGVNI